MAEGGRWSGLGSGGENVVLILGRNGVLLGVVEDAFRRKREFRGTWQQQTDKTKETLEQGIGETCFCRERGMGFMVS